MNEQIDLIEKILSGDDRAFGKLVVKYQRLVSHIVFRMIRDGGDQEDVCQEVFLKVYKSLKSFRGDSKLSTWIGKITYNRCVDYLNRKKIPLMDDDYESAAGYIPDENAAPDIMAEAGEISQMLQAEIGKLPPLYRAVVTFYHLDELTYAEIGDIMKLPDGTVKSYLFRARRLLKERLVSKFDKKELWQ